MMLKIYLLIFNETSTGSACHIPLYVNTVPTVHDYTKRDFDRCVAGEPQWTVSIMPLAYTHICIRELNSVIMEVLSIFRRLTGSLPANCSGGRCLLQHWPMSHGNWCSMYWPTFANCSSDWHKINDIALRRDVKFVFNITWPFRLAEYSYCGIVCYDNLWCGQWEIL